MPPRTIASDDLQPHGATAGTRDTSGALFSPAGADSYQQQARGYPQQARVGWGAGLAALLLGAAAFYRRAKS